MTIGDPRLSLTERHGTHAAYASAVAAAATSLQAQRLLLPVDVDQSAAPVSYRPAE
jgi:hypothetical protein